MYKGLAYLCFILLLCANSYVVAQPIEEEELPLSYGDEDFVSIATGSRQPLRRAPAVATVITAADIESIGATNLDQVLETIAGVHVSLSSTRFSPLYSIRGIHTDKNPQVLILVNGIPITQLYFGDRGANSTLPIASIARIEVIRGPGSAVYGADAFAGVINVITKKSDDIDGIEIGARAGSFNTQEAWLLQDGKWGGFDIVVSLEYLHTDGDEDRIIDSDAQTVFDGFFATTASLAPGAVDTRQKRYDARIDLSRNDWHLSLWNWRQDDVGVGPGLALSLDPNGSSESNNYLIDLSYHNPDLTKNWDIKTQLTYMDINSKSQQTLFPAGTKLLIGSDGNINPLTPINLVEFTDGFIGNPEVYERHMRFDVNSFYSGFEKHRMRLSVGANYADLRPKETKNFGPGVIDGTVLTIDGSLTDVSDTQFVFIKEEDRFVYYATIQDEWSFAPDWDLTTGLRYDHYSDFGPTLNPRLALVWQTQHNMTSKLLYGRAFRAPSFAELFTINNPITLGNPGLDPETINTLELSFNYQPNFQVNSTVSFFAYKIDDLIEFVEDPSGTTSTAQNTGSQTGQGLEIELTWQLNDSLKLNTNYAYQHAIDVETDSDPGHAPSQQFYLHADWRIFSNWFFNPQINWVGDRKRSQADPRDNIDDYTTVDLTLRRKKANADWGFAISVRNVFNEEAVEPSPYVPNIPGDSFIPNDFPLSGRSAYAELRYNF